MASFIKRFEISPIQKVFFSFILLILTGAALLSLPASTRSGISFVDALFTSTSAVCVTGLTVVNTAESFTAFGQGIIAVLIQLGGLGIMTFSLSIFSLMGGSLSLKWRFTFENIYSDSKLNPIKGLLKRILVYTITIETAAALLLFLAFIPKHSAVEAARHAVFHSISAFCNAGFSTFQKGLVPYAGDLLVVITTAVTIMSGGLGFLVINELFRKLRHRSKKRLTLHTKMVLSMTAALIIGGTLYIAFLEWDSSFSSFSLKEKIISSFFQSVTCRTAGFNTVDISGLRQGTHCIMLLLMFIGGSPGSIAGGIKTTTLFVIIAMIAARFKGHSQVRIGTRAVSKDVIDRSTTLAILSFTYIFMATAFMLGMQNMDSSNSFLAVLFEVVSAFATVGLSMGVTEHLSGGGKMFICLTMLLGRLGPLTLIMALTSRARNIPVEYPEEQIMIG